MEEATQEEVEEAIRDFERESEDGDEIIVADN